MSDQFIEALPRATAENLAKQLKLPPPTSSQDLFELVSSAGLILAVDHRNADWVVLDKHRNERQLT